jgi:hypothetical protein
MQPLLGRWVAVADSPMGPVRCTREFEAVLRGSYVRLSARWEFGGGVGEAAQPCVEPPTRGSRAYEEIALIGSGEDGRLSFWSFTSDGKRSNGCLADVSDIHEEAIGFEARMPAGLARMVYWPDGGTGFYWAVEARSAKGWTRFTEHHYVREEGSS